MGEIRAKATDIPVRFAWVTDRDVPCRADLRCFVVPQHHHLDGHTAGVEALPDGSHRARFKSTFFPPGCLAASLRSRNARVAVMLLAAAPPGALLFIETEPGRWYLGRRARASLALVRGGRS